MVVKNNDVVVASGQADAGGNFSLKISPQKVGTVSKVSTTDALVVLLSSQNVNLYVFKDTQPFGWESFFCVLKCKFGLDNCLANCPIRLF
ncbi:hypothetical protein [Peribacillus alkalitolerans]|uniref:hypothetical protein n=1 Tax=Peribacillus alkalitolerans TaxID=1550385 RepID=UPI003B84A412